MPPDSYYVWVTRATTDLLTAHSDIFVTLGLRLFKGFALILIAWTGAQIALGSASGVSLRFDRFAGLLISIAFTYAMLKAIDLITRVRVGEAAERGLDEFMHGESAYQLDPDTAPSPTPAG